MSRGVVEKNAITAELLNHTRAVNGDIGLPVHKDPTLTSRSAASASRFRIGQPRHGKTVELQRHIRRADGYTRGTSDGAGDIIHQLAVLGDGECSGNGPADIRGMDTADGHNERAEKFGQPGNGRQT